MKKLSVILAAIVIPMTLWSQKPTHTLTTEVKASSNRIEVYLNKKLKSGETVKKDTVFIVNYQLEEGETYTIKVKNPEGETASANTISVFAAWMRDGAVCSTSPEMQLTMGKTDIHLTAVMTRKVDMPYSPGANWFDVSTGVLTLDEIHNCDIKKAVTIAQSRYQFEMDDVVSMVVKGEVKRRLSIKDFCFSTFNNLQLLDLSQASGMVTLMSGGDPKLAPALEHIILGPGLDSIGENTFYGFGIKTIDCYAVKPPICAIESGWYYGSFSKMTVTKDQVLVRVPPESVESYKQAKEWNTLPNIQPLYETSNITVTIPTDVAEGYYENMTVELTNLNSKVVLNHSVFNKREFRFNGLVRGSEYQAVLKNAYGQVMGQTAPAELGETDITLTIGNLLRTKDVTLKVTDPDGMDVTRKVLVLWTDESDKLLGHDSRLKAVAEGAKLNCKVTLNDELAQQYVAPDAVPLTVDGEGANLLTVGLQPIQQLTLRGQVKDKETGEIIAEATVAVTQRNRSLNRSVTVTTDDEGRYELQGTNMAGELSVTAPGYLSKTVEFASPASDGALPSVELEPFNGVIVTTWLTYTAAAKEGAEGKVTDGFDDNGDVVYEVYNQTKDAAVENFIVKGSALYLLSGVETGDELNITAASRDNHFSKVSATCTIEKSGMGYVTLSLKQTGGLEAAVDKDGSNPAMAILYDPDGRYVRSITYKADTVRFSDLASGDYTLVSMTFNSLLRRVLLLSTFDDMGLKAGTDYVKNTVHIEDGIIATVSVADVPVLDEEKIRFTDSETYFNADKNLISLGQSVAIWTKLYFADQYVGRTGNVEFLLDMPEGIDLAGNSALAASAPCSYRIEDGHYVFPVQMAEYGDLRLSLSPKQTGEFRITGSVRFTLDGVRMVQPIGTVWVLVQGFALSRPAFVTSSTLYVCGTAPTFCKNVEIYDHNNLVGTAKVDGTGDWFVNIHIPGNKPAECHAIKARTTIPGTGVTESEVCYVSFSDNHHMAKTVMMVPPHKKESVMFNFFENSVSLKAYTFILPETWKRKNEELPYYTEFNFLAFFDGLDESKTDDVRFAVLASDGTTRTLKAKYDAEKQCYYASSNYPNSSKLPVSAYAYVDGDSSQMNEEENAALTEKNKDIVDKVTRTAVKAAEKGNTEVLPGDEETLNLKYTVSGKDPYAFTVTEMDFDDAWGIASENAPFVYRSDEDTLVVALVDGKDEAVMILMDVNEHTALRMGITYAELDDLGAVPGKRPVDPRMWNPSGKDAWKLMETTGGMGSGLLNIVGVKDYIDANGKQNAMETRRRLLNNAFQREINAIRNMLNEWCDFARQPWTFKQMGEYHWQVERLAKECEELLAQLDESSHNFTWDMRRKAGWDIVTTAVGGAGKLVAGTATKVGGRVASAYGKYNKIRNSDAGKAAASQIGFAKSALGIKIVDIDELCGFDFDRNYQDFIDNIEIWGKNLMDALKQLRREMEASRNCNDDEDKDGDGKPDKKIDNNNDYIDDDYSGPKEAYIRAMHSTFNPNDPWPSTNNGIRIGIWVRPLIDPSGYVYEAVPSNRIEGATATIFCKDILLDNGTSAGEREVMWDAENYGQVNPQTTGADGMYQWDVPQGLWQVRVQKEGYEDNASEWLPVPPPQLDVNIPIVRARLPKVETAHAYKDAVTVKFDTYMLPALLTKEQITVMVNGSAVKGTISLTDEEEAPDGAVYASQLRFVPTWKFGAKEVTLTVSGQVKSYAGIEMDEPYEAVLPIEEELKNLVTEPAMEVEYLGTGTIRVKGTPASAAAGKTVKVKCMSGIIASATQTEVVLDANGEADVTIQGDLPGNEIITFTMEDPELTTSTLVKVVTELPLVIEAPEASVATETEVAKGTEITLTCKTEGAAIYYTLDGSSPLNSDTRILYDGTPVVINAETTLAAVAVIDGKGSSEVRTWHYTVSVETRTEEVSGSSMQVTPARVRDSFVVTGVEGMFSLRVYSMSGKLLLTLDQVRSGQRVDASALPAGIHLVVVNTPTAAFTQRIIKY